MSVVIEGNTAIPTTVSKEYTTQYDNQKTVDFPVSPVGDTPGSPDCVARQCQRHHAARQ